MRFKTILESSQKHFLHSFLTSYEICWKLNVQKVFMNKNLHRFKCPRECHNFPTVWEIGVPFPAWANLWPLICNSNHLTWKLCLSQDDGSCRSLEQNKFIQSLKDKKIESEQTQILFQKLKMDSSGDCKAHKQCMESL